MMKQELGIEISGRVIHGDHYGKRLGFPTANLDRRMYARRQMKIKFGVYAGQAIIGENLQGWSQNAPFKGTGKGYRAAIVIGPMDKNGLPKIEAHLLGFRGDLYGKKITLVLAKFLRPFKKFVNVTALKKQIRRDITAVKQLF